MGMPSHMRGGLLSGGSAHEVQGQGFLFAETSRFEEADRFVNEHVRQMVPMRDTPNTLLRRNDSGQVPEVNAWHVDEIQMDREQYRQEGSYMRDQSYL